jgi:hypothetical protein
MSRCIGNLRSASKGVATTEFALAVPGLILMIWAMFQIGLLFLANAGMHHALGEAARYATIYPTPTDAQLQSMITSRKFGLGNGTWGTPSISSDTTAQTRTIMVTYSHPTDFLFFTGPTVSLTKSRVVYLSV